RFAPVQDDAAPELQHGFITALCASRDGSLWIACSGSGLLRLKDGVFSRFTEAEGLPTNHLNCVLEASDGAIWIGSELGLARYSGGKFATLTEKHGLGNNSVRALCEDARGVIRAATGRGLSAIGQDGVISTMNFDIGSTANILKSVCRDSHGNVWVASNE